MTFPGTRLVLYERFIYELAIPSWQTTCICGHRYIGNINKGAAG